LTGLSSDQWKPSVDVRYQIEFIPLLQPAEPDLMYQR
jgi:hypothetical protein